MSCATALVSIIVPCFNTEGYINATLESVQAQTFKAFEAILVDDGSTDGSLSIMQKFADVDQRFKIIHLSHNRGIAMARNAALEQAQGEFVAMLDSDDLWTTDALAIRLDLARRYDQADVIATDFQWFEEALPSHSQGRVGMGLRARKAFAKSFSTLEPSYLAEPFELVATTHFAWVGATLIRRAAMTAIGNFDADFTGPEDTLLWLRLSQKGAFVFDPRITAFYRQRPGSLVTRIKGPKEVPYLEVLSWVRKRREFAELENIIDRIAADCHHVAVQYFRHEDDCAAAFTHAWSALKTWPWNPAYWRSIAGIGLDVIRSQRCRLTK